MNQAYTLPFRAIGEDVVIWEHAKIVGAAQISIGDSVIVDDFAFVMGGENTVVGSFVHIASHATLVGGGELVLDDFVGVSGGVRIYTGNDDYLGGHLAGPAVPQEFRGATRSYVRLGKHVLIGANSVILPGVTIGEGAIVGALSLVKRNIEPWTINVGNPCNTVGPRRRDKIPAMEAEVRAKYYDAQSRYIPRTNARKG